MGVYGNLLTAFPELYRRISVWTEDNMSDLRTIVGIYLPAKGDKLKRWKFSSRGSAINYADDELLFVSIKFKEMVHLGDYFRDPEDDSIHRIIGDQDFRYTGGFIVYTTERVTGATAEQNERLTVKEATFA